MSVQSVYETPTLLKLDFTVEPQEYGAAVNKELKKYSQRMNVPGFRPGHAPMGLVKKMAGKGVVMETLSEIVGKKLYGYIEENNLDVLGRPQPLTEIAENDIDMDCKTPVTFSFEVALSPEFELLIPNTAHTRYEISVDEPFLEERVDYFRRSYGEIGQAEEVAENDWIFGKLAILDENGNEIEGEGAFNKLIVVNPERIGKKELFEPFYGLKVEDKAPIDIFSFSENTQDLKDWFFLSDEELEKIQGKSTNLTIKRISRTLPAEMSPAFYEKVFKDAGLETEEEFKSHLALRIIEELSQSEDDRLFFHAMNEIVEAAQLEMPDAFLKRWLVNEEKLKKEEDAKYEVRLTEENIEEQYTTGGIRKSFEREIVEGKIIKLNPEIMPTAEEVDAEIIVMIERMSRERDEHVADVEALVKQLKKDREFVTRTYNNVKDKKLKAFVLSQINVISEPITASAYIVKEL